MTQPAPGSADGLPTPILSIIIPVWNRSATIGQCLASIQGAQDRDDWEIVIVDDGSTDDSVAVIHAALADLGLDARARVIEQDNAGPGAARNTAIAAARGTWIVCLDSDDLWLPWTLPTIRDLIAADPAPDVLFLRQLSFAPNAPLPPVAQTDREIKTYRNYLDALLAEGTHMMFGACNLVARHDLLQEIGGFRNDLRCYEDIDLFLRLPLDLRLQVALAPVLFRYRDTPGSLTSSFEAAHRGLAALRASEAEGRYPGGAGGVPARRIVLARVAQWTVMNGWLNKRGWASYGLFLRSAWELTTNRCRLFILRYHRMIARDLSRSLFGARSRD